MTGEAFASLLLARRLAAVRLAHGGGDDTRLKTPSTMSLLGLVRHMAEVEHAWFRRRFAAEPVGYLYCTDDSPDADLDDVAAASAAMYVHPNTFRYRLRMVTEVSGIDLTDPEARFAAMLQLRAVYPAGRERPSPSRG